jgi:ribonuclease VapC
MGDCFTYACARAYRTKIAYKGNDFTETDLGW